VNAIIDRALDYTHLNRAALVSFLACLFFFFGCGDGRQLPDEARSALGPRVEAVRAAAAAGDRAGAQAGVDQLRADLSQLRGAGVLSEEDAARVLDAVDAVEARLALLPAPTTTTTATTAPPPNDQGGDGDEDGRRGKGKGGDDD
jgi:hypothetical protein